MDKANVFIGTVALNSTPEEAAQGQIGEIVVPLEAVVASDIESAKRKLARKVPAEHANQDDRLEVRCIPFTN